MNRSIKAFTGAIAVAIASLTATFVLWPRSVALSQPNDGGGELWLPAPTEESDDAEGLVAFEVFAFPTAQPELGRKVIWSGGLFASTLKAWAKTNNVDPHDLLIQEQGYILLMKAIAGEGGFSGFPQGSSLDIAVYTSATKKSLHVEDLCRDTIDVLDCESVVYVFFE